MESLYRTYRPQTFSDVVGQQHVVGTLEHAVLEGRTSHAYLFCGPRGTGKTTMARLLAKALMCEQGTGHLPDGTCEQCKLIASGEHPDVYELDAASRTGVDNVREEIINRVSYAPVRGRYKVYIIDEVHMLTTAAFNALLKTLEEPPGHVVFVLCTTDPQKIPATILSRVQRFDFRPIGNDDILARLAYVCEQEGFTYEDAALELVVRHARGGMRDALSTLEQLSVFGGGVIGLEAAQDLLGAVPGAALGEVVEAIATRNVPALFTQVGGLVDAGRDLLQFTRELAAHMRDVYVVAAVGTNASLLPAASDVEALRAEAQRFGSTDRLARILTLLGDVSREMSTAPNQRLVLEIAFTRIARPKEDLTLESLAERMAELERAMAARPVAAATLPAEPETTAAAPEEATPATAEPATESEAARVSRHAQADTSRPEPAGDARADVRPTAASEASRPASNPASAPQAEPTSAPVSRQNVPQPATVVDKGALQRMWRQVVSNLLARIPARGSLISSAVPTSDDGSTLVVGLPKGSSFALRMLDRPEVKRDVEAAVAEVFGPRALSFREGIGSDLRMPAQRRQPRQPQQVHQPSPASQSTPQATPPSVRATEAVSVPQTESVRDSVQAQSPYPMPWDEPAPQAQQTPQAQQAPAQSQPMDAVPYDMVPYEEMDMAGFVDDYDEPAMPAPQNVSVPEPAPAPAPAPQPAPTPVQKPSSTPTAAPEPPSGPAASSAPKEETPSVVAASIDDLPDDLVAILENAFEVFGSGVRVNKGGQ